MWQKVDPRGFRTWIVRWWVSEYFAPTKSKSSEYIVQDLKVRKFIEKHYNYCWISKVVFRKWEIDWKYKNDIIIFTAKPGLVLWKDWDKLEKFKKLLEKEFWQKFDVTVKEFSKPELAAKVMWEHVASQLEKRMPYRRVIKTSMEKIIAKWAKWVKMNIAWRLNGAEMSRSETFKEWRIPLQTLRADVDYYYLPARTKYWILWVKIWIYKWYLDESWASDNKKKPAWKKNVKKNIVKSKK